MGEDRGDGRSRTILGALGLTIAFSDDTRARSSAIAAKITARSQFQRLGTAVRCAAAALHSPFCKTKVAVKSIFDAMG
jgi:hypothetical protein